MKLLALGDIVGERTVSYLRRALPEARRRYGASLVVANGENAADIRGLTPEAADALFACGVDVLTAGNHIYDRRAIADYFAGHPCLLRPLNYPADCPGDGARVVTSADGWQVLVLNAAGRVFMEALDDPFRAVEYALERDRRRYDFAVLDIHAEATAEKLALARYFDGRIAAVFGTHTHIQTADARLLPGGTGYITDLGMCGPTGGILGVDAEAVIARLRTHMPRPFTVAEGEIRAEGALFDIDAVTGRACSVEAVRF